MTSVCPRFIRCEITHHRNNKSEEMGIIPSPNAIIDPLAVMVTAIYTVVALYGENNISRNSVENGNRVRTILQWLDRGGLYVKQV